MKLKSVFLITVIISLFSVSASLYAQNTINAKVVNSKTSEPVVFATVRIKGKNLATISDEGGYFRIPPEYKATKDTLQISSIGYQTKMVLLESLEENQINIIELDEAVEELSEVVIYADRKKRKLTGYDIVRMAIKNIPLNYPRKAYSYVGYYRDYQLENDEYTNLNEGVVEFFDAGFQSEKSTNANNQALLLQYKKNEDFRRNEEAAAAYDNNNKKYIPNASLSTFGGNELSILDVHDPIRNYKNVSFSYINTLEKDFTKNHNFKIERSFYLDDVLLYEISFATNDEIVTTDYIANGSIHIEAENFAIHKLEYYAYALDETFKVNNGPFQYRVYSKAGSDLLYSLNLEYARQGDFMYPNYISFNNKFRLKASENFKLIKTSYNKEKGVFTFEFNSPLLQKTILKKRNYRIELRKKSFKVEEVLLAGERTVSVVLSKEDAAFLSNDVKTAEFNLLDVKFRNIRDIENRKLDEVRYINIDQFREFFVQKVFTERAIPKRYDFIRKNYPLSITQVVDNKDGNIYWINTPLKKVKKEDDDLP